MPAILLKKRNKSNPKFVLLSLVLVKKKKFVFHETLETRLHLHNGLKYPSLLSSFQNSTEKPSPLFLNR